MSGFAIRYTFMREDGKKNTIKNMHYASFITQCLFPRKAELYALDIPTGITAIEDNAFYDCPKLKQVTLHGGLQVICVGAFQNCPELEEISIPSTVVRIGAYAFAGCTKLKVVKVYSKNIDIATTAFDEGVEIKYA